MRATFYGFETTRKALMAAQTAIDVTNQNVSNVNTEGFTRQRVDLSAIAVNATSRFATVATNNVGMGVNIDGINQIRDAFLDIQYRKQTAETGEWETKLDIMQEIESVLDEYNVDGLGVKITDLYTQLKNFSENCDSVEYATVFRSSAQKVTEIFNQYAQGFDEIRDEYVYDAKTEIDTVNNILDKVVELNKLIKGQIAQGVQPNELLDSRNLLLDQICNMTGASIETDERNQVSIKLGDTYLLETNKGNKVTKLALDETGADLKIKTEFGDDIAVDTGSIAGYLKSLNGKGPAADTSIGEDATKGLRYFEDMLNTLANSIAKTFNDINDATGTNKLFIGGVDGTITADNIGLSKEWIENAEFITKSTVEVKEGQSAAGRNDNLLKMLDAMDTKTQISPFFNGTFEEFMTSIIGEMAVETNYLQDMYDASELNLNSITEQRESVVGVSLDEETINLIKFQKAYNAAARVMTAMDEMLDTLINATGVVGR